MQKTMCKFKRGSVKIMKIEEQIEQLIEDSQIDSLQQVIAIGLDSEAFKAAVEQKVVIYEDGIWRYRCILIVRTKAMTTISRF